MTTQTPAYNRRTPEWKAIRLDLAPLTSLHWDARDFLADAIYNAVQRARPSALPSPASDRCTCDKFERGHDEHEPWCGGPAPSAPPPASEAEQPKCTHGQEDCEACHGEGSINCPHGCEPRRSAPTAPTPAGSPRNRFPRSSCSS